MFDAFLKKEKKRHPHSAGRCGAHIYIYYHKENRQRNT